ncbi:hypothetical protein [Pandoraea anhela]|uniref:Uncharacterized protein n=1 Tax=Pandoraea anhela TaxID=2508295 RepID=A0A5E4Z995_9BURK|nr:hypothetical protein [Pandoraea anhela]VVE57726.1 hypothetical protein PAN31108_05236 [Pandoraea anhela]
MQAESHWFVKDLLTVITLLGVFYNMQEGRDSNPIIHKAISVIENRYDRLNTWMIQSSESQIVAGLWVVTKWVCITCMVLLMAGAKIYPHPTQVYRSLAYAVVGSLFIFSVCNRHLAGDRHFDWRPLKWGVLAALLLLVTSAFFQFSDTAIARTVSTSLEQTPLNWPFWLEKAYLPLIIGGTGAVALVTIGLTFVVAQALPSLLGRLALRLTLRSMKGLATLIAWLDPQRKFAWFMFFVCAGMQLISNHL